MASKLTNIFFIAFFLISTSTIAQQKSFTPKKGEITFVSETSGLSFTFQHIFKDTLIVNSQKVQGVWVHNLINTNNSDYVPLDDSTNLVWATKPTNYEYSFENNPKIVEYRNEHKIIAGYKCFKVTYEQLLDKTTITDKSITPPEIAYTIKKEFWVTEKIKTKFNPICRERTILEKYYPLEISYTDTLLPGIFTNYKLKSISLSD